MSKLVFPLFLLPLLAGCAVVDLAAHGVKSYEKSRQQPVAESQTATAQPAAAPAADTVQASESESEPVTAAPPSGGAIRTQSLD